MYHLNSEDFVAFFLGQLFAFSENVLYIRILSVDVLSGAEFLGENLIVLPLFVTPLRLIINH